MLRQLETFSFIQLLSLTPDFFLPITLFYRHLPNGTSFIPGTVTIDNVPQTNANPAAGISLGTINNGASRTVTFQATVVSLPSQNPISNTANITFQYTPIAGGTTFNGLATSNSAGTQVNLADINGTKSVNKLLQILVKR